MVGQKPKMDPGLANQESLKMLIRGGLCRYTQEQLYAVVSDVSNYKEFVPWCQRSVVTEDKPPDYMEAELEVGFKMFVER